MFVTVDRTRVAKSLDEGAASNTTSLKETHRFVDESVSFGASCG